MRKRYILSVMLAAALFASCGGKSTDTSVSVQTDTSESTDASSATETSSSETVTSETAVDTQKESAAETTSSEAVQSETVPSETMLSETMPSKTAADTQTESVSETTSAAASETTAVKTADMPDKAPVVTDISSYETIDAPEEWRTDLLNKVLYVDGVHVQLPMKIKDIPHDSAERLTLKANDMLFHNKGRILRTVTYFDMYPHEDMPIHSIACDAREDYVPIVINGVGIGTSRKEVEERLGTNYMIVRQAAFRHDLKSILEYGYDDQGYVYICMTDDTEALQEEILTRIGLCFDENDKVSYIAVVSEEYYDAMHRDVSPDKVLSEHKTYNGKISDLSEKEASTVYIGGAPVTVPCKLSDIDDRFEYLVIQDSTNGDIEVELYCDGRFVGMFWTEDRKKEITEDTVFTSFRTDPYFMGFDYHGINDMSNYEDLPHEEDTYSGDTSAKYVIGPYLISVDFPDEYSGANTDGRTALGITYYPALALTN
ncbi:MAG: hypothetical protein IKR73_10145 [Oscillospiraceae bacterium]|nr:hypothetical protein [Oscillospiraceae bacterium]